MRASSMLLAVLGLAVGAVAMAEGYLKNRSEVEALLTGATLNGVYLRTQSPYTLEFRADGVLINQTGAEARWWVSETGQYCREWLTGQLMGNKACMDIARSGERIAIYSNGNKVAEGELSRK